jgi:hypothetical protein
VKPVLAGLPFPNFVGSSHGKQDMARALIQTSDFVSDCEANQEQSDSPRAAALSTPHLETDGAKVLALWINHGLTHRQIEKRSFTKSVNKRKRRVRAAEVGSVLLKIEGGANALDCDG